MGNNTTGLDQGRVIVGTIVKRHLAPGGRAINFKDEDWLALPVGTALYAEIDPTRPLTLVGPVGYIHAEELRRAQNASLVERVYVARKLSDTDNVPLFTAGGVITHQQLLDLYEAAYQDGQNNPNGYSSKAQRDEAVAAVGSVGGDDHGEVERLEAQVEQLKHIAQKNVDRNVDLSAQLAERDALLREVINGKTRTQFDGDLMHRILMALSASAEQSAPKYPRVEIVRAHEHTCANVQPGSTSADVCDCGAVVDGVAVRAEPSAPVERDDRAEFVEAWNKRGIDPVEAILIPSLTDDSFANVRARDAYWGWKARADLESKRRDD